MLGYQRSRGLRIDHILVNPAVQQLVKARTIDRTHRKLE